MPNISQIGGPAPAAMPQIPQTIQMTTADQIRIWQTELNNLQKKGATGTLSQDERDRIAGLKSDLARTPGSAYYKPPAAPPTGVTVPTPYAGKLPPVPTPIPTPTPAPAVSAAASKPITPPPTPMVPYVTAKKPAGGFAAAVKRAVKAVASITGIQTPAVTVPQVTQTGASAGVIPTPTPTPTPQPVPTPTPIPPPPPPTPPSVVVPQMPTPQPLVTTPAPTPVSAAVPPPPPPPPPPPGMGKEITAGAPPIEAQVPQIGGIPGGTTAAPEIPALSYITPTSEEIPDYTGGLGQQGIFRDELSKRQRQQEQMGLLGRTTDILRLRSLEDINRTMAGRRKGV